MNEENEFVDVDLTVDPVIDLTVYPTELEEYEPPYDMLTYLTG